MRNHRGKFPQLHLIMTIEDKGVFTTPRTATLTYVSGPQDSSEIVCAENMHQYYYDRRDAMRSRTSEGGVRDARSIGSGPKTGRLLRYLYGSFCRPRTKDSVRKRFTAFGGRVLEYLASLERDDQVICSAMEWMELKKWHTGQVVLVGDAARANSPMMGQGGCMAVEDACVLAEELRAAATVDDALASFVRRRKSRVEWVQRQSMEVGEILTVPSSIRNAGLRERGNEAMQAHFGALVPAP